MGWVVKLVLRVLWVLWKKVVGGGYRLGGNKMIIRDGRFF